PPAASATTRTTRRSLSASLRTTRRTAVSTATDCCLRAYSIPPCTGSTAIFLNAVAATGGPWALPSWPDELRPHLARNQRRRIILPTGGRQAADLPPTLSRHRHREAARYPRQIWPADFRDGSRDDIIAQTNPIDLGAFKSKRTAFGE